MRPTTEIEPGTALDQKHATLAGAMAMFLAAAVQLAIIWAMVLTAVAIDGLAHVGPDQLVFAGVQTPFSVGDGVIWVLISCLHCAVVAASGGGLSNVLLTGGRGLGRSLLTMLLSTLIFTLAITVREFMKPETWDPEDGYSGPVFLFVTCLLFLLFSIPGIATASCAWLSLRSWYGREPIPSASEAD